MNGIPKLKLLNCLNWLLFMTMAAFSYGVFPLSYQLKDNFPGNSIKGQICMKIEFKLGEENVKQRILGFVSPCVFFVFLLRFKKYCNDYVEGQNMNMKTFSQFGGAYHRNLFTLSQTGYYFCIINILNILDNLLIVVFQQYEGHIDKQTQFIIHNLPWIVVCDLFFGIYIPIKHIFSSRDLLSSLWWESKPVKFLSSPAKVETKERI